MNRLPQICECTKPNSQKRCRVWCGLLSHPSSKDLLSFDEELTIPDSVWDTVSQIRKPIVFDIPTPDGYEPMLDSEGNPLWLLGYPVFQKKGDEGDG